MILSSLGTFSYLYCLAKLSELIQGDRNTNWLLLVGVTVGPFAIGIARNMGFRQRVTALEEKIASLTKGIA
jgi:hypothetical protein